MWEGLGVQGWALKSRHKVWVRGPEPQLLPVDGRLVCPIQLPGHCIWVWVLRSVGLERAETEGLEGRQLGAHPSAGSIQVVHTEQQAARGAGTCSSSLQLEGDQSGLENLPPGQLLHARALPTC